MDYRHLANLLSDPSRLKSAVARRISPETFRLGRSVADETKFLSHFPDRYSAEIGKSELSTEELIQNIKAFTAGNEQNNLGDLARLVFLQLAITQVQKDSIKGDVAEFGVYKGNTAYVLAEFCRKTARKAYLFDTFEGFFGKGPCGYRPEQAARVRRHFT